MAPLTEIVANLSELKALLAENCVLVDEHDVHVHITLTLGEYRRLVGEENGKPVHVIVQRAIAIAKEEVESVLTPQVMASLDDSSVWGRALLRAIAELPDHVDGFTSQQQRSDAVARLLAAGEIEWHETREGGLPE